MSKTFKVRVATTHGVYRLKIDYAGVGLTTYQSQICTELNTMEFVKIGEQIFKSSEVLNVRIK